MHLLHRSNDTGHWRGSNDLLKITVRIATGGTPACEIVRGHCPPRRSKFFDKDNAGDFCQVFQ